MPTPPPTDGPRAAHPRGPLILLAIVVVVAGATVALDQYAAAERDRPKDWPADRTRLARPDIGIWVPTPLGVGRPAPGFRLPDVRTGVPVALDEFRGRPVVLLLSSYG